MWLTPYTEHAQNPQSYRSVTLGLQQSSNNSAAPFLTKVLPTPYLPNSSKKEFKQGDIQEKDSYFHVNQLST